MAAIKFACISPHPPITARSKARIELHEPVSLLRFEVRRLR